MSNPFVFSEGEVGSRRDLRGCVSARWRKIIVTAALIRIRFTASAEEAGRSCNDRCLSPLAGGGARSNPARPGIFSRPNKMWARCGWARCCL